MSEALQRAKDKLKKAMGNLNQARAILAFAYDIEDIGAINEIAHAQMRVGSAIDMLDGKRTTAKKNVDELLKKAITLESKYGQSMQAKVMPGIANQHLSSNIMDDLVSLKNVYQLCADKNMNARLLLAPAVLDRIINSAKSKRYTPDELRRIADAARNDVLTIKGQLTASL